jgi:hypothetical protein
MIVNFEIENKSNVVKSFYFIMERFIYKHNNLPYYVAILGNDKHSQIEEFSDDDPEECIKLIRKYFLNKNMVPINISVENILEPYKEFTQYLLNFGY